MLRGFTLDSGDFNDERWRELLHPEDAEYTNEEPRKHIEGILSSR
jgi:hypothetical protein